MKKFWLIVTSAFLAFTLSLALHDGAALADGGSCAPGSNYSTCEYSAAYSWSSGNYVAINYFIDGAFPSNLVTDIQQAAYNWQDSGANVRFTEVYYPNYSNLLTIEPSTDGYNFYYTDSTCGGNPSGCFNVASGRWANCNTSAAGQSWAGGSNLYHTSLLNSYLFTCWGNPDPWWVGIAVHEMGHAMGLAHNSYPTAYSGTQYAMYQRMNANSVHLFEPPNTNINGSTQSNQTCLGEHSGGCAWHPEGNPQFDDYGIFNSLYSSSLPKLCGSQPSDYYCDGMDPVQQGCPTSYPQETYYNPYGWETLYWSGTVCESNWTKGAATASGWKIYRIQVQGGSGLNQNTITIEDAPNSTSWYTNLVYSPNNLARSCISYINSSGYVTSWYCTKWH